MQTIRRSLQIVDAKATSKKLQRNVDELVGECVTVSALALDELARRLRSPQREPMPPAGVTHGHLTLLVLMEARRRDLLNTDNS